MTGRYQSTGEACCVPDCTRASIWRSRGLCKRHAVMGNLVDRLGIDGVQSLLEIVCAFRDARKPRKSTRPAKDCCEPGCSRMAYAFDDCSLCRASRRERDKRKSSEGDAIRARDRIRQKKYMDHKRKTDPEWMKAYIKRSNDAYRAKQGRMKK